MFVNTQRYTSPLYLFLLYLGFFSLVFGSILTNNYLINDDWVAIMWERGQPFADLIRSHPYYTAAVGTGRTVGHILTAIVHYPLTNIEKGIYIRFISLLWLSGCATLLMNWMVTRCEYPRLFSAFFIASALLLPCFYQSVIHITGQYLLHTLFFTILSVMMADRFLDGEDLFGGSRLFRIGYFIFLGMVLYLSFQLYQDYTKNLGIAVASIFSLTYIFTRWYLKRPALSPAYHLSLLTIAFLIPLNTYAAFALFYFTAVIIYALSPRRLFKPEDIKKSWQLFAFGCFCVLLYFLLTKFSEGHSVLPARYSFNPNFDLLQKGRFYVGLLTRSFAFWAPEYPLVMRPYMGSIFLFIGAIFILRLLEEADRQTKWLGGTLLFLIIGCLGATISHALLAPTMTFIVYRILMPQTLAIYFLIYWSLSVIWTKYLSAYPDGFLKQSQMPIAAFLVLCCLSLMSMDMINKYFIMPKKYEINYVRSMLIDQHFAHRIAKGETLNILIRTRDQPTLIGDGILSGEDMTLSVTGAYVLWINSLVIATLRELGVEDKVVFNHALQESKDGPISKGVMKFSWGHVIFVRTDVALKQEIKAGPHVLIDMRYIGSVYR